MIMTIQDPFPQLYPRINEDEDDPEINSYAIAVKGKETNDIINFKEPKMIEFLRVITKGTTGMSNEYISIISKLIRNTKLIQRVEVDHHKTDKRVSISAFCGMCAGLLQFQELKKGDILFRIHDIGDKCFFLIKGKLSVLKLKDVNSVQMTSEQYLNYLLFLKQKEEGYILQEVIRKNYQQFPIDNIDDLALFQRLLFLMTIRSSMDQERFTLQELVFLFKKYKKTFGEFNIDTEMIQTLWYNKTQHYINSDTEWKHFLNKAFDLKSPEAIFFNRYSFLLSEAIKEWICICYESFLYLGNGSFFGDTALDTLEKKRNASIRAETDTIVASLSDIDYLKLIAPKNKKEKADLITYLYNNFFFKTINSYLFEKLYFHHFAPHEYLQHHFLHNSGTIPKELIFLKEGKVEINMKCSVINLHYYIKYLIEQITTMTCFTQGIMKHSPIITKEIISDLKQLIQDQTLNKLQSKSETFIKSMNKMHTFQLFILTGKDLIGIEEIILNRPFMTIGKVLTIKASFFRLDRSKLNKILDEERSIRYSYTKFASNKLISLIERLHHLKKNSIDLTMSKINHEESVRKAMLIDVKTNLMEPDIPTPKLIHNKIINKRILRQSNIINCNSNANHHININKKDRSISLDFNQNNINSIVSDKKRKIIMENISNNNHQSSFNNNHTIFNSQFNISDDKIFHQIKQAIERTYVNYKNKFLSLSKLQKETDEFSTGHNESQNMIKVFSKRSRYKNNLIPNNICLKNHLEKKYNHNRNDESYQSVTANELLNKQFNMSFVNLLHIKEDNYDSLNTSMKFKPKINVCYKKLPKLNYYPNKERDKISFLTHLKKTLNHSNSPSQDCSRLKITKYTLNINDDLINKSHPDLIAGIVKDYYQNRKKCGYSVIINNPNNYYLQINHQVNNKRERDKKTNKSFCGIHSYK